MKNNYILVKWPNSQLYMDEPWFDDEAVLASGRKKNAAFFIPENRIINNDYIVNRVKELCKMYKLSQQEIKDSLMEWENSFPYEGGMSINELVIEGARISKQ